MAFSPKDILKHDFSKSLRGFDPIEVEAYLEVLADKFSDVLAENKICRDKIEVYEKNFKEFDHERNKFRSLQNNTQKSITDLKVRAEREAKIILMDAKLKAEKISTDAYKEVGTLRQEIDELKQLRASFLTRFKNILRQQIETLDLYARDIKMENKISRQ